MKQKLLLKVMLLLCALIAGSSSVWATDVEITSFSNTSGSIDSYISYAAYKGDGTTDPAVSSSTLRIYKPGTDKTTGGYITVTAASGYKITSIIITNANDKAGTIKVKVDNGDLSAGISLAKQGTHTVSSINASSVSFYNCGSDRLSIAGFSVTYTSTGSGGNSDPSISLSPSSISATKAEKNGTINVTYSNITTIDSEVLFYESDGSTAATYNHDWITASINGSNNIAYSISANTSYARTAYIKVHQKNSEVYSGLLTVTQDGAIYTVNIQTPTGGTLVVKNGDTPIADGDAVNDGTELTITPTAADGYRYRNWQAVDASTHTYTTGYSYTINKHDVTIKANFDAEYSVNWSVNGNVVSTRKYVNNETIVFPNRPSDVLGKKFVGWTATEIAGTQADVPTLLAYGTKMGTSNVTYYAVFADASGESSTATLTGSEISSNLASAQMAYGTEKTYTDTSDGVTWVGCGITDAASRPWVQLRSKADAYFKITTSKNIEEVKITITSASNSSGGITDITKHTAFSGTVCLESEAKGTPTGALASSNTVSNNIVTVPLPISSKEFYIQTTAGARVWGIELSTNSYTYSNYRTTVPTTASITLNAACTDGNFVYGTYSNSQAFVVSDDIEVSEVSVVDGKLFVGSYNTGDVVPANTGVMVAALAGGNYDVNLSSEAGTSVLGSDNMLKPSGDAGITAANMDEADTKFYRLTMHNGTKLGFWWGAASGAAFALAANKAYLAVPAGTPAPEFFGFGNEATSIESIMTQKTKGEVYDLQGRKVANPAKGLYIVNGKKYVVK